MTTKREAIDMSEAAITSRLEQVRALYKLMVSLRQIRIEHAQAIVPEDESRPLANFEDVGKHRTSI